MHFSDRHELPLLYDAQERSEENRAKCNMASQRVECLAICSHGSQWLHLMPLLTLRSVAATTCAVHLKYSKAIVLLFTQTMRCKQVEGEYCNFARMQRARPEYLATASSALRPGP